MTALRVPAMDSSVAAARRFIADQLPTSMHGREAVILMTSELVANVVRHAQTEVTVSLTTSPVVRVEVSDGVAATDAFRELIRIPSAMPDHRSLNGRGLRIVHDLASDIGLIDEPGGGKTVWFELDVGPS